MGIGKRLIRVRRDGILLEKSVHDTFYQLLEIIGGPSNASQFAYYLGEVSEDDVPVGAIVKLLLLSLAFLYAGEFIVEYLGYGQGGYGEGPYGGGEVVREPPFDSE